MELFARSVVLYVLLFLLMRAAGHRQFAQMTAFDAVLVVVIGNIVGQSFIGEDYSVTAALVIVASLVFLDLVVSMAKSRWEKMEHIVDGIPTLLINEGDLVEENLKKERVSEMDILRSARERQGLDSLEKVRFAVLEPDGKISIVPWTR